MPAAIILHSVPIGAPSRPCGCGRPIYFVESLRKDGGITRTPIDCDVEGGQVPTKENPGRGVNHFVNCALRDQYRKKVKG